MWSEKTYPRENIQKLPWLPTLLSSPHWNPTKRNNTCACITTQTTESPDYTANQIVRRKSTRVTLSRCRQLLLVEGRDLHRKCLEHGHVNLNTAICTCWLLARDYSEEKKNQDQGVRRTRKHFDTVKPLQLYRTPFSPAPCHLKLCQCGLCLISYMYICIIIIHNIILYVYVYIYIYT